MSAENGPREFDRGVVAFLDVLGTKSIATTEAALDYVRRLRQMREFVNFQLKGLAGLLRTIFAVISGTPGLVEETAVPFSDSIVIWVPVDKGKDEEAIIEVATVVSHLIHFGLANQLPLRGAISVGPFVADGDVIVGSAIAEAVEWEGIADWSGVLLTPTAASCLRQRPTDDTTRISRELFVSGSVPLKSGTLDPSTELVALAWPNSGPANLKERIVGLYLSKAQPIDVTAKFLNTLGFVDRVQSAKAAGTIPNPGASEESIVRMVWDTEPDLLVGKAKKETQPK
jgi:hypothetical protein